MTTKMISRWRDGDSGEYEDANGRTTRFRLSGTKAPDAGEPGYKAMQRIAQRYAPEGDEVEVQVVATDAYGRKLVKMRSHGRDVNSTLTRWSKEFKE